jgi:hypothetical protein
MLVGMYSLGLPSRLGVAKSFLSALSLVSSRCKACCLLTSAMTGFERINLYS